VQVGSSRSGYPGPCPGSLLLVVSLPLVDGHDDHSCCLGDTIPRFMSVRHLAQKSIGSMNQVLPLDIAVCLVLSQAALFSPSI
jgi:hypothetical protein